jgi:hypothetical protein
MNTSYGRYGAAYNMVGPFMTKISRQVGQNLQEHVQERSFHVEKPLETILPPGVPSIETTILKEKRKSHVTVVKWNSPSGP